MGMRERERPLFNGAEMGVGDVLILGEGVDNVPIRGGSYRILGT